MGNLAEKLSSYNLLNFLLPGASFCFLAPHIIGKDILPSSVIGELIISYFVGMLISRMGSIFLENILKGIRLLKPSIYRDYVTACKVDSGVGVLLETCNMYRTFASGALIALVLGLSLHVIAFWSVEFWFTLGVVVLLTWSFVKQYGYVSKRVAANLPAVPL